jgi:hypothetical protein
MCFVFKVAILLMLFFASSQGKSCMMFIVYSSITHNIGLLYASEKYISTLWPY